ncbi:hypothetical protein Kpol_1066p22 [Vanderwaltozyma polyspora DSM 70294]|uniref:Succinate dehydrogenase assembly factor 4, mitochondrial n=1 Tax=Vanderwaltozyma polyspora (strain ATCC 22028 / DSM 70294 / BCRC 21397 / CBS 2163 / NBRC 10782 / NRRL Y-8283 / UCD 57-17) TaxID=436907 RepID=A7TMP3_VANPO|nr:uncharacterized protein Kpol_1066p22 [Vanderwaltozyma polyspora DSM 70294]EDO16457.1 hypothetical protein Kpol_1066p22 [Vanderwaltozyma polyspora DSM 70294]
MLRLVCREFLYSDKLLVSKTCRVSGKNIQNSGYSLGRSFNTASNPSPPKLPKEDQEEFERLQKIALSQAAIDAYNEKITKDPTKESLNSEILTKNDIGSFHPDFIKTIPEFEGDVNPKTGEIGGPKQDPLRHGDYSFNGRCTDF